MLLFSYPSVLTRIELRIGNCCCYLSLVKKIAVFFLLFWCCNFRRFIIFKPSRLTNIGLSISKVMFFFGFFKCWDLMCPFAGGDTSFRLNVRLIYRLSCLCRNSDMLFSTAKMSSVCLGDLVDKSGSLPSSLSTCLDRMCYLRGNGTRF